MKSTRKEVERYQLETFRDVCTEFPAGEIIDSEEPDFLININDGVLGVELTELYHESSRSSRPMQAIEKLTDSIVEEACSIHRTAGGPVLTVRVDFELLSKRLGKAQRTEMASRLAALILKTPVEIGGYAELENDYDDLSTFPEEITRIRIQRNRFRSKAVWSVPRAAFIPRLDAQLVQHRIDEKNERVIAYREKSREVWLVMVHTLHFSLASTFEYSSETLGHTYCSAFDRTFLFNLFDRRSHELMTHN
jgi:hypothetical protein